MNSISQLEQDELDGTTAASGTMLTDPSCPPKILLAPSAPSAWLQQGEGGSRRWGLVPNRRWDFCSPALGCPQPLLVPAWRETGGLARGHSAHRRRAPGSLVWSPPPEPGPVLPCLLARMAVVWELRAGCGQAVGMAGVQRCGEPGSCMAACCELQSTTFSCTIGFEQGLMEGRTGGAHPLARSTAHVSQPCCGGGGAWHGRSTSLGCRTTWAAPPAQLWVLQELCTCREHSASEVKHGFAVWHQLFPATMGEQAPCAFEVLSPCT